MCYPQEKKSMINEPITTLNTCSSCVDREDNDYDEWMKNKRIMKKNIWIWMRMKKYMNGWVKKTNNDKKLMNRRNKIKENI